MAKLTKEEFKQKYNDQITDNDDLLISLLEDIEDSMEEVISEEEKQELDTLKEEMAKKDSELEELKRRYKERFLSATDEEEPKVEELEEKKVIDITEI